MTLSMNQFSQSTIKGKLDQQINPFVVSGRVGQSQATALVPGQAVKLADTLSKIPEFLAAAAGEDIFGFVTYSLRKNTFSAGDALEIASMNSVMYMEANTSITRGIAVEIIASGQKVTPALGTNTKVGVAFDKASAQGDLIRVVILTPAVAPAMSITDLYDTPATLGTANQILEMNSGATALEWVAIPTT